MVSQQTKSLQQKQKCKQQLKTKLFCFVCKQKVNKTKIIDDQKIIGFGFYAFVIGQTVRILERYLCSSGGQPENTQLSLQSATIETAKSEKMLSNPNRLFNDKSIETKTYYFLIIYDFCFVDFLFTYKTKKFCF